MTPRHDDAPGLKIAHVMAGAATGGAELFFERLTVAQHRTGDAILPIIRRDPARAARLAENGLPPMELRFGGRLDFITRPLLRDALRQFAPRVAIAWMNRAARFTPRGNWVLAGRLGGYYDLDYYRRCDHLIGNTRGITSYIAAQGWAPARVHHLPNFAPDFAGIAPERLGVPADVPLVLAMGRLHRNKAFDVLIQALKALPGVHAIIAGDGPERPALAALARDQGVEGRLHMPGWRQDTGALLAGCDVLACPSRHEPLGNVVVEAFSAGRPVVAAAAAGPRELIRANEDGLLVPIEDSAALATSLGLVLGTPALAARLALAGRARFVAEFAEQPVLACWRTFLTTVEKP
jgi:glycosyltransferase involved in cell wall biosynthesis